MSSLYELTVQGQTLLDWLNDPEMDEEAILTTLESVKFDIENKAEDYVHVLRIAELDEEVIDSEIKALQAKKKVLQNRKKRLKNALFESMKALNIKVLKAGAWTLKIQKNGGIQPLEIDEVKVPENYYKIVYTIDNDLIRKTLERGEELSFARLLPRGESLRIK